MCDPLDYWYGNTEVIYALSLHLSHHDLGHLCQLSVNWRESLNIEHLWFKLCRRVDPEYVGLFGKVREGLKKKIWNFPDFFKNTHPPF